ncbi:MAG: peptidase S41 [Chitinophagaceae bacterium]|nr:peptidase S41 [Chitinophagaceae bacterium]
MKTTVAIFFVLVIIGCTASKTSYNPNGKFSPQQLQEDYTLFESILEESHPGLYWYTPKDSMDYYFEQGKLMLHDSLTETKFRNVLSYVVEKIRCGHTAVKPSKKFSKYMDTARAPIFPLTLKFWPDTAVITSVLNRRDSTIRGGVVTTIDSRSINKIVDSLFQFLSADGFNLTHKYQTLSNRGAFGNIYTSVFGTKLRYQITYQDSLFQRKSVTVNSFVARDTSRRAARTEKKISPLQRRKMNLVSTRRLRFDSTMNIAYLDLNTFAKGYYLNSFFKRSFRQLKKKRVNNLVIDLRGNGGGSVSNSNLLTKYISQKPFKIADSLYALRKGSKYGLYQQNHLLNWLFLVFFTHKKSDGYYHFRYFEGKYFKPKKRNHFDDDVYVLTGGNTFSASTLFVDAVKHQNNVTIIGEETGGGAYGNNAWLIPDVILPNTRVRFRLPLFRLVINKNLPKGRGIMPEVQALPTVNDIRKGVDFKMLKAKELIQAKENKFISKEMP